MENPSNCCCAALQKKYSKLAEKYSKVEKLKNQFRDVTTLLQQRYDAIEKENGSLKQELSDVKVQAESLKDEKDNESAVRVDLEDEVSALKDEIESLKRNRSSASQEVDAELQERLRVVEKEIGRLKELLEIERGKVEKEKKNSEMVKKKADEAVKNAEAGIKKASEEIRQLKSRLDEERGQVELEKKNTEMERKKAAEALKKVELEKKKAGGEVNRLKELLSKERAETRLLRKNAEKEAGGDLKSIEMEKGKVSEEIKLLKELLEKERGRVDFEKKNAEMWTKKADDALKKVEMEKTKAREAQMTADIERRRAEETKLLLEKLKMESDAIKSKLALEISKSRAVEKEVQAEKQNTIRERKRADTATAKAEEQRELAELNLKKAMIEKERADDLIQKLEEERNAVKKLELSEHLSSVKLMGAHSKPSATGRDASTGMMKHEAIVAKGIENIILEKERTISKERNRAESEIKKARKQKKVAEAEKHRADQLSRELEGYKLRLEELQKELQELVSYRILAESTLLSRNSILVESDTVKLLKNQLNLEKMLVKHAQQATEVEAVRNTMLHQEIFHLKQVCTRFQQHLDMLDNSCLHNGEGTRDLKKMDNQTFASDKICSDWYPKHLLSGIDSGLDPQYRGSNQKLLKSSAINSSSASFSDRPLVGSQERGTFSVTTSANLGGDNSNVNPAKPIMSNCMDLKYAENGIAVAGKSIKAAAKGGANDRRADQCDKKRIVDAVESIEILYSKGLKLHQKVSKKLSLLHGILQNEPLEPRVDNVEQNSCGEHVRPFKRRKTPSERTVILHPSQDAVERKSMINLDTNDSCACTQTSPPAFNVIRLDSCSKNGGNVDFEGLAHHDYMKLLDLDNADDEILYRRAIATPLSPTLPDIQLHENNMDDMEMLAENSFQEGLSDGKDELLSISNCGATKMQKNASNLESCELASSNFLIKDDSVDVRTMGLLPTSDNHFQQTQVLDGKLGIPDLSGTQNKGMGVLCETNAVSIRSDLKFVVIFSDDRDERSISRILQTSNACVPKCSFLQSADVFLRSIIVSLESAADLSMKEKACIFFSLILHGVSEVGTNILNDVGDHLVASLSSATSQIHSALSDLASRRAFIESCNHLELLALAEDFLMLKKIWACAHVSAASQLCGPKIDLILNGNAVLLTEQEASTDLLVAGASAVASLCFALDHLSFLCEMSCNIFTMQKFDSVLVLAVLHSFSHICGSKYFATPQYAGVMTVVKSLVVFLEKRSLSSNSTSFSAPLGETVSRPWSCANCPFSEGAVSMEDVASLLLEKLRNNVHSVSQPHGVLELVNSLVLKQSSDGRNVEVLGKAAPLGAASNESLSDFIDSLSLIEILASFMTWEWIANHLTGQLCELLESCLVEGFSAAIITLLGQLGRIGVIAGGYEDTGVEKIRQQLSAITDQITFGKLILPVQFTVITALCGLISVKFGDILESKVDYVTVTRHSIPADFIREWFFSLSDEHQSFLRCHLAAGTSNSRIESSGR